MADKKKLKNRGALINPHNRFDDMIYTPQAQTDIKTKYIEVDAKSIVSENNSPDVGFNHSINAYQGCEHGCTYCYARPTHNYWGYSSGLEFESTIFVKRNAVELFQDKMKSKSWRGDVIMISGNTDCYQPAESKYGLTGGIIRHANRVNQSLALVTKSNRILKDIDVLEEMASKDLVSVAVSINTLDDEVRRRLEPRATSIPNRIKTAQELASRGIPVTALLAPMIPNITDHEIYDLVQKMADIGVRDVGYLVLRLNNDIGLLFENWLEHYYPDRAQKVINKVKSLHGGKVNDSEFGTRMKGSGIEADQLKQFFTLAKSKFFPDIKPFKHNTDLFLQTRDGQLSLF